MITEYLYVPLIVFAIAQCIKFLLAMFRGEYRPSLLFASGGMPSVHSATVTSLAMVALIEGGVASPLFGVAGVFAAIVIYDSLGVRRAAGEQAKVLNVLISDLSSSGAVKVPGKYGHLREVLGHRPLEVLIGMILGVFLTGVVMASQVFEQAPWLLTVPSSLAQTIELVLAGFLLVTSVIVVVLSRRKKATKLSHYRPFFQQIAISNVVIAVALALLVLLQKQAVLTYSTWLLVSLVLVAFLLWHAALWYLLLVDGKLRMPTTPERDARKDRWLKKSKRTRKSK
jgi:hypothetical protein